MLSCNQIECISCFLIFLHKSACVSIGCEDAHWSEGKGTWMKVIEIWSRRAQKRRLSAICPSPPSQNMKTVTHKSDLRAFHQTNFWPLVAYHCQEESARNFRYAGRPNSVRGFLYSNYTRLTLSYVFIQSVHTCIRSCVYVRTRRLNLESSSFNLFSWITCFPYNYNMIENHLPQNLFHPF